MDNTLILEIEVAFPNLLFFTVEMLREPIKWKDWYQRFSDHPEIIR